MPLKYAFGKDLLSQLYYTWLLPFMQQKFLPIWQGVPNAPISREITQYIANTNELICL